MEFEPYRWIEAVSTTTIHNSGYRTADGVNVRHSYDDKPARIEEAVSNKARFERWYSHGEFHRSLGPAEVVYKNGKIVRVDYYINSKHLTKEEFERHYLITFLEEYKPPQGI